MADVIFILITVVFFHNCLALCPGLGSALRRELWGWNIFSALSCRWP